MYKKIFIFLTPLLLLTQTITISCINKNEKNWGDKNFKKNIEKENLNNLTYVDKSLEAKNEAPFIEKQKSNVIYQLTVYSFADGNNDGIGDFIGLKNNIDYFVKLGINTLYLSPIHPASSYHGYDVIDYLDVAPELGGMEAFKEFLKVSHANGIKVVMDLVFNHSSFEHPWFQEALNGNTKYQNYYYFLDENISKDTQGLGIDSQDLRNQFKNLKNKQASNKKYVAHFWPGMPDLNLNNSDLIKELKAIQRYWSKIGVDGFRYDAFYHFFDSNNQHKPRENGNQKINSIFQKLRSTNKEAINDNTQRSSKEPFLFGEWWKSPFEANDYLDIKNQGLDSVIDGRNWKDNINVSINAKEQRALLEFLNKNNSTWMPFLDNHDVERWINKVRRQINKNVASVDKLSELEISLMKYALVSLLSRAGSPILYNGNELNLHGGPKQAGDHFVREAFPWKDRTKQVDFYELRSGKENSRIFLNLSKNEEKIEDAIKNENSTFNLVKQLNEIRNKYQYVVSQDPNTIADLEEILSESEIRKYQNNLNLRKNNQGEYLLYIFGWGNNDISFKIKNNFKIDQILLQKNININTQTREISSSGIGTYAVLKINKKSEAI
ncbi:ALPHA-AMYLASE 3 (1,4-ALPHA-D-GLUCAN GLUCANOHYDROLASE); LIPOPROTEIN [Mycoplasmopsis pulmonis]|uniref:Alpha-amylase n=1 Tax=Mycoplasmopsis pulmonis (strain UAB CTIP) TaxID=272635 RepID=Q98PT7_MYCPU|nr:alpha-amylase family glycosyl hydrolase [Mycoplasmopsis pulmonis]MDZ7293566.1 alpha-amylase family glycosyl hydrolase [Mycoplasmopsis pulmonis]CAC13805.1 ALPHA-AMYLASE 3 (1,4-ALPHA-D-GLUCAN GLUCANOHYDROLASE); LIPOPROTEIN [Mycoplasmopsis pulmonis]VEU68394.1 Alpha-amylase precursor [Mycoplasmopsis pulmonis]